MPVSQTITAFYSFNPSTTIRSAEVNNNFNFIRGHIYPIDGSLTAFANNAYDLGSSSFGWRGLYLGSSATLNVINSSLTTFSFPTTSGRLALASAPTIQRFTSGSGTYTTPAGVSFIKVKMVGGGAGGAGSGTGTSGGNSTAGGNTTFGTSLLTANGGALSSNYSGGSGGTVTVNSPAITLVALQGMGGTGGQTALVQTLAGSPGGSTPFAGAGVSGAVTSFAAITNSGSGGAGGAATSANTGAGGAAGGYIEAFISSPSATYSYAVGAAGSAGAAGTSGAAGNDGSSGVIIVEEYY